MILAQQEVDVIEREPFLIGERLDVCGDGLHVVVTQGELKLLESPWDPIAEWLPVRGAVRAQLTLDRGTARSITLEGPLDPDAFWPHVDTIGSSRWPGTRGGPKRPG